MIKAVFFDLDGTLLPMEQEVFIKAYFGGLCKKMAPRGYKSEELVSAIWQGTKAMVINDGAKTNEERWWDAFCAIYGERARDEEEPLDEFYLNEFKSVSGACGYDKRAKEAVDECHKRGFRVVLATNPIFPRVATLERMRWAGVEQSDFELITTYENSRHCKPNPEYYKDILKECGLSAEECVMVGNDVKEDMVARTLGMKVFLLTDNIINKDGEDIDKYPHGSFDELIEFIKGL